MRRRQLLFAAGAFLAPFRVSAQAPRKPYRVGFPSIASEESTRHLIAALEQGLQEQGYAIGRDVVVEFRSTGGKPERLPEIVADVIRTKPDVILTGINRVTVAVKSATQSIPIVMAVGTEVVRSGLVQSYARPGGNITGVTWDVGGEVVAKRIEILKEIQPKISRLAVWWNPPHLEDYGEATDRAATALRITSRWIEWSGNLDRDMAEIVRWRADAILIHLSGAPFQMRRETVSLALKHRLPTANAVSEYVEDGGLLSYGPNFPGLFRRAANYIHRILEGAKPGELPVEQPTQLELVINLGTASALGIKIPYPVLLRANRVIE